MYGAIRFVAFINVILGRHIAFYIGIYLAIGAVGFYQNASGDEILGSPPISKTLVPSMLIYSVLGIFSAPWILVVQYINIFALIKDSDHGSKSKGLSTLVGLIDLIIGVWLALAVQWQSTFLPPNPSACSDSANWQVSNGQQILFQRFGVLNGETAEDACNNLVGNWRLALGLTVLTLFASLIEFLCGSFVGFVKICWAIGAGILPATKYILTYGYTKLPTLLFWVIKSLYNGLLWLIVKIGLCIPRRLAPPVRYRSRYWRRSRLKRTTLPTHELHLWRVNPPTEKQTFLGSSMEVFASNRSTIVSTQLPPLAPLPAPLIRLLSSKENDSIVLKIVGFLHYTDVVTLSLLSKRVRSELFRSSSRVEALCIASCVPAKFECYCCNTQVCESCRTLRSLRATDTAAHLHNCVIHCSRCYRKKICAPKSIHSPPVCMCSSEAAKMDLKSLCRFCDKQADGGIKIREMRERSEIVHLAGQELKCGGCKRRLPSHDVRWWVCNKCGKECTSNMHPQWARATGT